MEENLYFIVYVLQIVEVGYWFQSESESVWDSESEISILVTRAAETE